jgi:hypothetical protein
MCNLYNRWSQHCLWLGVLNEYLFLCMKLCFLLYKLSCRYYQLIVGSMCGVSIDTQGMCHGAHMVIEFLPISHNRLVMQSSPSIHVFNSA